MNAVKAVWVAVTALALPLIAGSAVDPLSNYYFNSLVTQNRTTKAMAHVWLNRDHSYVIVYDLGPQSKPLDIDGPYRVEAWMGSYTLKSVKDGHEVCLKPEPTPPRKVFRTRENGELFASAGCYPIAARRIGETWKQSDAKGREYDMWFLANR